jgi:LPS-assembly protein
MRLFFLIFLSTMTWKQVFADSASLQGVLIKADSMSRDLEKGTVELEGNIQVSFKNQVLSAKKAKINLRAKTIDAQGKVIIITPEATIGGERIITDYESDTSLILGGFVQSGTVFFEGSLIQKLGPKEYYAQDAKYTTCTTCPEAWSFSGASIRAELGGYAFIRNSVLYVGSFPSFWLPYLIVPLKSDRQTGLLTPEIEKSESSGLILSQSFFWALSRSQDATFTFKNYELRGRKALLNYRYVTGPNSFGEFDTGFIQDYLFSDSLRLNTYRSDSQKGNLVSRWFIKYQHYYELPEGFVHRAEINDASDLQYPTDFPSETKNTTDPAMQSSVSLTKNWHDYHLSVNAVYFKNMLQANPLSSNENAIHRLPEITFSKTPSHIMDSSFLYSFEFNYTNFTRQNSAYDDLFRPSGSSQRFADSYDVNNPSSTNCRDSYEWENQPECRSRKDGTFNPNLDLIRTGQRLSFKPTIFRPIKYEFIDLLPSLSFSETNYRFGVTSEDSLDPSFNSNISRRFLRADFSARSSFYRVFGDLSQTKSERIKYEIQPEISYTRVPWVQQPAHPFFGALNQEPTFYSEATLTNNDLNSGRGVQFDYEDRLFNNNLLAFTITNKLIRKTWSGSQPDYRQFLNWRISQLYNQYEADRNPNISPWSELISELSAQLEWFEVSQKTSYYHRQRVSDLDSTLIFKASKGDFLSLGHSSKYTFSQAGDPAFTQEFYNVSFRKDLRVLDLIGKLSYRVNPDPGQDYLYTWAYGAQLKLPGDCWYINIIHIKPPSTALVKDNTSIKANFGFMWDGSSKKPLDFSILDSY